MFVIPSLYFQSAYNNSIKLIEKLAKLQQAANGKPLACVDLIYSKTNPNKWQKIIKTTNRVDASTKQNSLKNDRNVTKRVDLLHLACIEKPVTKVQLQLTPVSAFKLP